MNRIFPKTSFLLEPPQRKRKLILDILITALLFMIGNMIISIFITPITIVKLLTSIDFSDFSSISNPIEYIDKIVNLSKEASSLPSWAMIIYLVLFSSLIIAVIICRVKIEKGTLKSLGLVKKKWLKNYLLGFGIGTLVFSLGVLISVLTGGIKITGIGFSGFGGIITIILFLLGYIIQGAGEEFIFRGYMMTAITRKHSVCLAVVLNSIFFAIAHLGNNGISILSFVNLTLFGIFTSLIMIKTGNILIACAIHSSWNFFQGNFFGISVSGMEKYPSALSSTNVGLDIFSGGDFGLEGSICVTIVLVIGVVIISLIKPKDTADTSKEN